MRSKLRVRIRRLGSCNSDLLAVRKELSAVKGTCLTPEQVKLERERDRLKMSDVLRQRTALESELNKLKADKFSQNRHVNTARNEVEILKQQLEDQKAKNKEQEKELEKYKTLAIPQNLTSITQKSLPDPPAEIPSIPAQNMSQAVKSAEKTLPSPKTPPKSNSPSPIPQVEETKNEETELNVMEKVGHQFNNILMNKNKKEDSPKVPTKAAIQGIIPVPVEASKKIENLIEPSKTPEIDRENEKSVRLEPERNMETPVRKPRKNSESSIHVSQKESQKEFQKESQNDLSNPLEEGEDGVKKTTEEADSEIKDLAFSYINNTIGQYCDETEEEKATPELHKKTENDRTPDEKKKNKIEIEIEPAPQVERKTKIEASKHQDDLDPRNHRISSLISGTNMNDLTENISNSSEEVELEAHPSTNNIFKSRVSIVDIMPSVKIEFKLILQNRKVPYEKIHKIFPSTKRISLQQLKDHLKSFQKFGNEEIEQMCRYLVENDANGDLIPYDEQADMDKIAIVSKFKNKVVTEDYTIFDEENPIKKAAIEEIKQEISEILSPKIEDFASALKIEDIGENNYLSHDQFLGVLRGLNVKLKKIHIEYMVYEMYKVSPNARQLNYPHLISILPSPQESPMTNRYSEIEDDSYFQESITKSAAQKPQKIAQNGPRDLQPSALGDHDDTEIRETDNDDNTEHRDEQADLEEYGEGEDEYINDEEMIRIAEKCLLRIADELGRKGISIRDLFADVMRVEEIEDQVIELIAPVDFIDGMHRLGIEDFNELDIACLINLLSRQELGGLILIEELDILKDTDKLKSLIGEMLEKTGESQDQISEEGDEAARQAEKMSKRKGLNLEFVGDRSILVISKLSEHLKQNNLSLEVYFGNKIYEQLVKAKSKESKVQLISGDDFFKILEEEIVSKEFLDLIDDTKTLTKEGDAYQKVREDLKDILSLDANYKNLIFIKKLIKFIEEIDESPDLRSRAEGLLQGTAQNSRDNEVSLRSALSNFQAPVGENRRNVSNGGLNGGERLNTIEEEEKQYETVSHINKTQDRNKQKKGGSSFFKKNKINDISPNSRGFFSDSGGKEIIQGED